MLALAAFPSWADTVTEVHTGIREIFGDTQATKIRLGVVEFGNLSPETKTLLDVVRFDLALEGSIEIVELSGADATHFGGPRLEIDSVVAKNGVLATIKITAGQETLLSKNLSEPGNVRRLAHRAAREVLKTLTGAPGFFLSKIAFTLRHKGKKEIWIADWDGKNASRITSWGSTSLLPSFSRDGKKLAFTSYKDGNPDLFLYDLAKGTFLSLSAYQGLNTSAAFDPAADGFVATLSRGRDPNLTICPRRG
ncbi:MAG: hypothetical protein AAB091_07395, partial [Elusimicrobiota bacterium]